MAWKAVNWNRPGLTEVAQATCQSWLDEVRPS